MKLLRYKGKPKELEKLKKRLEFFADASISESTKRAYVADWDLFCRWCEKMSFVPLPATPQAVALFLADISNDHKASSMSRYLTVIGKFHKLAKFENPVSSQEVKTVYSGIKRTLGTRRTKAEPITWEKLERMISRCAPSISGIRDAAILATGWAAALRRSELVALMIDNIQWGEEGIVIHVERSKTDQEGAGYDVGIPRNEASKTCPVSLLSKWVTRMEIDEGPLFFGLKRNSDKRMFQKIDKRKPLSHLMVNNIVKKYCKLCGLNPDNYSSHSLRRGLATEAGRLSVPERVVMRHTRHRSLDTLRGYMDSGSLFEENPLLAVYIGN